MKTQDEFTELRRYLNITLNLFNSTTLDKLIKNELDEINKLIKKEKYVKIGEPECIVASGVITYINPNENGEYIYDQPNIRLTISQTIKK